MDKPDDEECRLSRLISFCNLESLVIVEGNEM